MITGLKRVAFCVHLPNFHCPIHIICIRNPRTLRETVRRIPFSYHHLNLSTQSVQERKGMMRVGLLIAVAVGAMAKKASAAINLKAPPTCYANCLSDILAEVGCNFADLNCYCGTSNTRFIGLLTGCVIVNCDSQDQSAGETFLSGACAVLTSGQTTLPPSITKLIPSATTPTQPSTATEPPPADFATPETSPVPTTVFVESTLPTTISQSITQSLTQSILQSFPTTFITFTKTDSTGQKYATTEALDSLSSSISSDPTPKPENTSASTGALIGGIVGGIIGFLILALLIMSIVLYALVRRAIEKRQAKSEADPFADEPKHFTLEPRSSVAASDSPEDELNQMEPSYWGVITRPKQALRVVNG